MSQTTIKVHVQTSAGTPIPAALLQIAATFPAGGTIPWQTNTDSSGNASLTIESNEMPIQLWEVTATGFELQSGTGTPPSTVTMITTAPTPAPSSLEYLAYYYTWYTTSWWTATTKNGTPTLGPYNSNDPTIIKQHIAECKAAGITRLIVTWDEGQLRSTFATVAAEAVNAGMGLAIITEFAGQKMPAAERIRRMNLFLSDLAANPSWESVLNFAGGKPLICCWGDWELSNADQKTLITAFQNKAILMSNSGGLAGNKLAVDNGFDGVAPYVVAAADTLAWFTEAAAYVQAKGKLWIPCIFPGSNASWGVFPRAGGALYQSMHDLAVSTKPNAIAVLTFNEWGEGTMVEPSSMFGTVYMDLTRKFVTGVSPTPPPTPPPPSPNPPSPVAPSNQSVPARTIGPLGIPESMLYQLWRLRQRYIRPEVHKRLHPLV
jgi:hypothetical protein